MFSRSTDRGLTWSKAVRVNDDPVGNEAWQWFATMSVAPNGRIDVIWNDTRNSGQVNRSELSYSFSGDAGETWSENIPISPMFDSYVGWPRQNKIGDYYHAVSDNGGVNIAYAATFNGEQDVYFLRIGMHDCNENGIDDAEEVQSGSADDCDGNGVPDECQVDCNQTGRADVCDILQGSSEDCNENGLPDECELIHSDFDGDGAINDCDPDMDNDGVPNEPDDCDFTPSETPVDADGRPISDTNGNCAVDLGDYFRFRNCFQESGPAMPALSSLCADAFDYDGNGFIDLSDYAGFAAVFAPPP